jgi:hypothetical protein
MTEPMLVVIRGNSGSGKTTTPAKFAAAMAGGARWSSRTTCGASCSASTTPAEPTRSRPGFITAVARNALDLGYHVVLEGILHTDRYADVLRQLIDQHSGPSYVYYLNVSFAETVRRHHTRAEQVNFTPELMRDWYQHEDLLGTDGEHVIGETSMFDQTVDAILRTSGLVNVPPLTPCPVRCPRCACKENAGP